MAKQRTEVAIIGGGIVGLATAYALSDKLGDQLLVLEAEKEVAAHQTGHNSGVIHSGLYYKPGSLKARNCVEGREQLYAFCAQHNIPHERCGKLVVATEPHELPALEKLYERGIANGLQGLRKLRAEELKEIEPHVAGLAGLHVPETGIVDYPAVARKLSELIQKRGGEIRLNAPVKSITTRAGEPVIEIPEGTLTAKNLIACCGLQADRIAKMCGLESKVQIMPFRGEYYDLVPERWSLVKNLIYPVPDPALPFLGVHFTRMMRGGIEAGPNAVLALKRHGYKWSQVSFGDCLEMFTSVASWKLGLKFWKTGLREVYRSFSKQVFLKDLQRLVPDLRAEDIKPGGAGVRAQAVSPDGKLIDDFSFLTGERQIHVLNAPSPAATASLSIGQTIAKLATEQFRLY